MQVCSVAGLWCLLLPTTTCLLLPAWITACYCLPGLLPATACLEGMPATACLDYCLPMPRCSFCAATAGLPACPMLVLCYYGLLLPKYWMCCYCLCYYCLLLPLPLLLATTQLPLLLRHATAQPVCCYCLLLPGDCITAPGCHVQAGGGA